MDQKDGHPIRHRVIVPLFGGSVNGWRSRADSLGFDPSTPHGVLVGMLDEPTPKWEAVVTFEVGSTGAVATGVEVRSTDGQPVKRAVWDRVRLAEVIREAEALAAWLAPLRPRAPKLPESDKPKSPGRPREYSNDHYQRVSKVYWAALAEGKPPVRAVALAFVNEFPGLTDPRDRRARSWVRAARSLDYIPEAESTKKGGELQ